MRSSKKLIPLKRILASLLVMAMVVTMIPLNVQAATVNNVVPEKQTTQDVEETTEGTKTEDTTEDTTTEGTTEDTTTGETTEEDTSIEEDTKTEEDTTIEEKQPELTLGAGDSGTDNEQAAELKTEIVVADFQTEKTYDGGAFLTATVSANYVVKVDGTEDTAFDKVNDAEVTWSVKGTDGNYTSIGVYGTEPKDAGEYKATITVMAREGKYQEATKDVFITIKKAVATVTLVQPTGVKPGSKVKIVVDAGDFTVASTPTLVKSDFETLKYTVEDAFSGTVLEDTAVLGKNADNVLCLEAVLKEAIAKNYELAAIEPKGIAMAGLNATKVTVSKNGVELIDDDFNATYTGSQYSLPVGLAINVYETSSSGDKVTGTTVTNQWGQFINSKWELLAEAPTNAGHYRVSYVYAGDPAVNAPSDKEFEFEIKAKEVTPIATADGVTFHAGMKASDVLKALDYKLASVSGNTAIDETAIDKDTFWGYITERTVTAGKEQVSKYPYKPEFKLQVQEVDKSTYIDVVDNSEILKTGKVYRVVPTNSMVATTYKNGGSAYTERKNLESVDPNYEISIVDSKFEITTVSGAQYTIDTSAMTVSGNGTVSENAIIKTYDKKPIFETRGGYKKAIVKDGDKSVVADDDRAISYQWEEQVGVDSDQTWKKFQEKGMNGDIQTPTDAGIYRLVINYVDPSQKSFAETVYVYYTIVPQKVKLVIKGEQQVWHNDTIVVPKSESVKYDFVTDDAVKTVIEDLKYSYVTFENYIKRNENFYEVASGEYDKAKTYAVSANALILNDTKNYTNENVINEESPISVNEMGPIPTGITVSANELTKVYDGKPITLSSNFITFTVSGNTVSNPKPTLTWLDSDKNELKEAPTNAGTYELEVSFAGTVSQNGIDSYMKATTEVVDVTIKKREVTAAIHGLTTIESGVMKNDWFKDADVVFTGVAEADLDSVKDKNSLDTYSLLVKDKQGKEIVGTRFLWGGATVELAWIDLLNSNYVVKAEKLPIEVTREVSKVQATTFEDSGVSTKFIPRVELKADTTDSRPVTTIQPIPYLYKDDLPTDVATKFANKESNYVAIFIKQPYQYKNTLAGSSFFQNTIEKAGGFVKYVSANSELERGLVAVFDAGKKDVKEFQIRWDEKYIEDFKLDFSNAALMPALEEAVAPKTVLFNASNTKMAVGDVQALDLKVTKRMVTDFVSFEYESSDPNTICVDENGVATALKATAGKNTVTITAYPVTGKNRERITEFTKPAIVKITVGQVTAPKINAVTTISRGLDISYMMPANGDKVEAFVLEGKVNPNTKKAYTAADFEAKIEKVQNNKWSVEFPVNPSSDVIETKAAGQKASVSVNGLKSNTDYTVYLRTVNVKERLEDGCTVAFSAAGSVKAAKVAKERVTSIQSRVDDKYYDKLYYKVDGMDIDYYTLPLKEKAVKTETYGVYYDITSDADDTHDTVMLKLPLSRDDAKGNEAPKLQYMIYDAKVTDDLMGTVEVSESVSKTATVDKNGNIKLVKDGLVCVTVVDTVTSAKSDFLLDITASADAVEAKRTITMQLGEKIKVEDLINYKEGKSTLNYKDSISNYDEIKQAVEDSKLFAWDQGWIVAVELPATKNETLVVKPMSTTLSKESTVTLKTVDVAKVTGLRKTMLTANTIAVEFLPHVNADKYLVTIEDAAKQMIYSKVLTADDYEETWLADSQEGLRDDMPSTLAALTGGEYGHQHYKGAKGETIYNFQAMIPRKVAASSKYTVSVTAINQLGDKAPVTSMAVTTTKGAFGNQNLDLLTHAGDKVKLYSYENEDDRFDNWQEDLKVIAFQETLVPGSLNEYMQLVPFGQNETIGLETLKSGQSYTLVYQEVMDYQFGGSQDAIFKATDKLVFKSSNPKVATVKAMSAGSAEFKTLKEGWTEVEVSSSITKKVVARYKVYVGAVAQNTHYVNFN